MHEIFVRNVPALNGLPGWGTGKQLNEVFLAISKAHWGIFGGLVDTIFIPAAGFWAIIFAVELNLSK
ncbi:hypothetical protein [Desulfoscipio gibsoniae]|nr:hypothetical protein [Desulfoscipio gibsoniae]